MPDNHLLAGVSNLQKENVMYVNLQKANSLEKTLMLGKIESKRRRKQQRMRQLERISDSIDMKLSKLQEIAKDKRSLACCSPQGHKESDTIQRPENNTYKFY